jgi:hypothetical protein
MSGYDSTTENGPTAGSSVTENTDSAVFRFDSSYKRETY